MIRLIPAMALGLLTACGGTSVPVEVSSGGSLASSAIDLPAIAPSTATGGDASFANLLNDVRISNGVDTVTYNGRLDAAAQSHADDMLVNNYFSHTGLNGSSAADRARAAGYDYIALGENIASGFQTEATVMAGWVGSPGHQRNNIDPVFEEFGLGYSRDGSATRWVLMLGAQ